MSETPEPPRGKIRCVNDKGQEAYVNPETANNRHWQRSTGYKPKPLPEKTELPKMVEQVAQEKTQEAIEKIKAWQPEPQPVQTEATPAKKKGGRPSKNTQLT